MHTYRVQAKSIEPGISTWYEGTWKECVAHYHKMKGFYEKGIGRTTYATYKDRMICPMLITIGRK